MEMYRLFILFYFFGVFFFFGGGGLLGEKNYKDILNNANLKLKVCGLILQGEKNHNSFSLSAVGWGMGC